MARPPVARQLNPSLKILGEDNKHVKVIGIGDDLTIAASGLAPSRAHDIIVAIEGKTLMELRLMSDRSGQLPPTIIWPQFGLDDPASRELLRPDEAAERWADRLLEIALQTKERKIVAAATQINRSSTAPVVMIVDKAGRILNATGPDEARPHLLVSNLPFAGETQLWIVPCQHDWHPGTPLAAATTTSGKPAIVALKLSREPNQIVRLPLAQQLPPGAYDLILRPARRGYREHLRPVLTRFDIVGSRRRTGLVVRENFWTAKAVLGGCVNKLPISGRPVSGAPYFRYCDTFEVGADVWGAFDPGIIDPGNLGKMCALYVIPSKTDAQWNIDNSLNHLAVLGGNAAVSKIKVQSGCINGNKILLWPNALQPGEYDIVADFGNNVPDLASFVTDAEYNTPLDAIDGYFVAGFRVVEDPGTLSEWANVGSWTYDETTQGTATVLDESGHYSTPGGFASVNRNVPRKANLFFPADAPGATSPAQISAALADYPLIVIIHGNGHNYINYDFLLQHFARNGFVAASIHLNNGMSALGRANMLFEHLAIIKPAFGPKLQNNIGVMGHSRGGEAVIKAARLNQQQALGHGINALIALGPTDQYGHEVLAAPWATPFFVLYGSRDGDITGGIWTPGYSVPQTGFALYDRADGANKHMVFVERASHNGFINFNENFSGEAASCVPPLDQQKVTLAYMNAFFRMLLRADTRWDGMFSGEWKPPSVAATGIRMQSQSRTTGQSTLDDFQSNTVWTTSSSGAAVAGTGLTVTPSEGKLHNHAMDPGIDAQSPHDSKGLKAQWSSSGNRIDWAVPPAMKNVSGFAVISIRLGQVALSALNPANLAQNMRIALKDGANNERAVRVSAFHELAYPDIRPTPAYTKSALISVRIPLSAYTIVCAGQVQVNLSDIVSVGMVFSETVAGEIDIDEIEFCA